MEHSQTSACAERAFAPPRLSQANALDNPLDNPLDNANERLSATILQHTPTRTVPDRPGYVALSRTTDRVLQILLTGDLARLRADSVAESLGMSGTTLRRRLRADHTCYQFLLDRARQFRCEQSLSQNWLPGKCLADQLGYLEVNSFYRAFRRWTGMSYSDYKLQLGL